MGWYEIEEKLTAFVRKTAMKIFEQFPELSYVGWVRNLLINKPDLTIEELQAEHDKIDWSEIDPNRERPTDKQLIYAQKNFIQNRWGVKINEIPKKANGDLNLSALVRLYLNKYGLDSKANKAIEFFATDGIQLTDANFAFARKTERKKSSPDANQFNGPRAGKPEPKPESAPQRRNKQSPVKKMSLDYDKLMKAKAFITSMGGLKEAQKILAVIEVLQN